jgi:hypothetical protein
VVKCRALLLLCLLLVPAGARGGALVRLVRDQPLLAQYTALAISDDHGSVEAETRLVRLDALLGQRRWARPDELIRRFADYGASHGAWDRDLGYCEGILARVVEAADAGEPELPSVSATPGFLCGTEFDSLDQERRFFEDRGLCLASAETMVDLRPGELLIFDNLAWAHGRVGRRRAGELHQRIFGYRKLSSSGQRALRDTVLGAFGGDSTRRRTPLRAQ